MIEHEQDSGNSGATLIKVTNQEFTIPIRTLFASATELKVQRSYGCGTPAYQLTGCCRLDNADKLAVMGSDETATDCDLTVLIDDKEARRNAWERLGLKGNELEMKLAATAIVQHWHEDRSLSIQKGFSIIVYMQASPFLELIEEVRERRLVGFSFGIDRAGLFVASHDWHTPLSRPVTWYLRVDENGKAAQALGMLLGPSVVFEPLTLVPWGPGSSSRAEAEPAPPAVA